VAGLPVCSGKDAVRAFERLGYRIVRQKGSHVIMKHEGRSSLTVPLRSTLKRGTLRGLISQSGYTVEEFTAVL
jgi:predicted RNA binding protein YcfA (HicA-like mRNA interferase family)